MSNTFNTEKKLGSPKAVRKELIDQTNDNTVDIEALKPFNTVTISSLNIDEIRSIYQTLKQI